MRYKVVNRSPFTDAYHSAIIGGGALVYYEMDKWVTSKDVIPIADIVICEEPYHKMNIKTYGELCKEVGKISAICTICEKSFKTIRPVDWKRGLSVDNRTPENVKREIRHGLINELGFVASDMSIDEQDAVLLGYYYETKMEVI